MSYLVAFDLDADLRHPGCPLCRAMCRVGDRYLRTLLLGEINEQRVRERIRRAGGLCREHALLAVQIAEQTGDDAGLAILAEWLLEVAGRQLRRSSGVLAPLGRERLRWRRHRPSKPGTQLCPTCEAEAVIVDSYACLLLENPARIRPSRTPGEVGLCLPHALRALELAPSPAQRRTLIGRWSERAERLQSLLAELIRARSHPRSTPSLDAARSAADTVQWIVGARRWGDGTEAGWPPQR